MRGGRPDRGSPMTSLRIPKELLEQLDQIVKESEVSRIAGGWTRSEWIVSAIREKLAHRERSKKHSAKKRAQPVALEPSPATADVAQQPEVVELFPQTPMESQL